MPPAEPSRAPSSALQEVLGYLNFSSGAVDPKFLRNLNSVYAAVVAESGALALPPHTLLHKKLAAALRELQPSGGAFSDTHQVESVLHLVFEVVLPAYRQFHRDLLFHQSERWLFVPFFLGRVFEAVLAEGGPWSEESRICDAVLDKLNDYIGHRPVAVLENERKLEPYSHEWVRPLPLYIAGAGVATGKYEALIRRTLEILGSTPAALTQAAWFDLSLLDELAVDPRAYDFNHPANKRPNYHFGQWDPHCLDNSGRFRRFVLQQVTLDALLERVDERPDPADPRLAELPGERLGERCQEFRDQRLTEAAVVLAGIMLMASGTSGSSPETHDSSVTLGKLLPRIAAYRDAFYRDLIGRLPGPLGDRLRAEAIAQKQPFAAARQHLNARLAYRRAVQLQHVYLAQLFARMGFSEAALQEAAVVPVVSARMLCQLQCLLSAGNRAVDRGDVALAAQLLPQLRDLLDRAIECGAIVDPWNILGFGGNFSLFPAVENTVPDGRVDDLLELMELIFALYARVWSQAAAIDEAKLAERVARDFYGLASWWDRFATVTVSSVKRVLGLEAHSSAEQTATALSAWHRAGAEAGKTAFWRPYVDLFDSPKAYAHVIAALLEKRDVIAAMSLLVHWIGQAERVRLDDGHNSFHSLCLAWMRQVLWQSPGEETAPLADRWKLVRKFFDYLEANAESYWHVPQLDFELTAKVEEPAVHGADEEDEDSDDDIFGAAYDEVTYRDSTADGLESELLEAGGSSTTDYELEAESKRIAQRLAFLTMLAKSWRLAAAALKNSEDEAPAQLQQQLVVWLDQTRRNNEGLVQLMRAVERQRLPELSANPESLVEYDRRRTIKEALLEKAMATAVATIEAQRAIAAAIDDPPQKPTTADEPATPASNATADEDLQQHVTALYRALLRRNTTEVVRHWPEFLTAISKRALLYIPLAKGGEPTQIVAARALQGLLRELLGWLPRLGLLRETCQLIETARHMEKNHPLGVGAVTEFDRLFEAGYKGIVESLLESSSIWRSLPGPKRRSGKKTAPPDQLDEGALIECLQQLTESLLGQWLTHSRTLRLSVLEKITNNASWQALVEFVEKYGHDLFTQRFLNFGNLRAILHGGVDAWLDRLLQNPEEHELKLLDDLDKPQDEGGISRSEVKKHLGLVLEAIVESYSEYRDYNSTTTQSDRGEMLYTLLDFLRLKAGYDRVNWNLRPVVMAHEVLVRRGREEAAHMWREAMAERTAEVADQHLQRLGELQTLHGMRLPTIAARLAERFVRPLTIDRLRALVGPSVEQSRRGGDSPAFTLLRQEADELAQEPTGAGLDVPDWLVRLEDEVDRACSPRHGHSERISLYAHIPWRHLSLEEIRVQLMDWETPRLPGKLPRPE